MAIFSCLFWLGDAQFTRTEPHLPTETRGRLRVDDRSVISGIVHVAENPVAAGSMHRMSMARGRPLTCQAVERSRLAGEADVGRTAIAEKVCSRMAISAACDALRSAIGSRPLESVRFASSRCSRASARPIIG